MDDTAPLSFWNSVLEKELANSIIILANEIGDTIKRSSQQNPTATLTIIMASTIIIVVCFFAYSIKKRRIKLEQKMHTAFIKERVDSFDNLQN